MHVKIAQRILIATLKDLLNAGIARKVNFVVLVMIVLIVVEVLVKIDGSVPGGVIPQRRQLLTQHMVRHRGLQQARHLLQQADPQPYAHLASTSSTVIPAVCHAMRGNFYVTRGP